VDIHNCTPHSELLTISSRSSSAHSASGRSRGPIAATSSCSSSAPAKVAICTISPSSAGSASSSSARASDARSLATWGATVNPGLSPSVARKASAWSVSSCAAAEANRGEPMKRTPMRRAERPGAAAC
jgi:hypothetical protein